MNFPQEGLFKLRIKGERWEAVLLKTAVCLTLLWEASTPSVLRGINKDTEQRKNSTVPEEQHFTWQEKMGTHDEYQDPRAKLGGKLSATELGILFFL